MRVGSFELVYFCVTAVLLLLSSLYMHFKTVLLQFFRVLTLLFKRLLEFVLREVLLT